MGNLAIEKFEKHYHLGNMKNMAVAKELIKNKENFKKQNKKIKERMNK